MALSSPAAKICACGNRKDRRAMRCVRCYHRCWSQEEDASLVELAGMGWPHKDVATEIGRSHSAVRCRARQLGLKVSRDVHYANRVAALRAFFAIPENVRRWRDKRDTPELRAKRSATASRLNTAGILGFSGPHTADTRQRMRASHRKRVDRTLDFAPRGHPLRELYHVLAKKVTAAEAREIIQAEIDRLPPFERQMLRVQMGANIKNKITTPAGLDDVTLGGVASAMCVEV